MRLEPFCASTEHNVNQDEAASAHKAGHSHQPRTAWRRRGHQVDGGRRKPRHWACEGRRASVRDVTPTSGRTAANHLATQRACRARPVDCQPAWA